MAHLVGGASTQSRCTRPGKKVELDRCSGAYEYTTDGRRIISWPMGNYGPLLGYPSLLNPYTSDIVHKLQDAMGNGSAALGDYAPKVEKKLGELLVERYSPYMTSQDIGVRFASNGTDGTQAAVALARYATERKHIISIGYHGGSSPVFGFPPQNSGILRENSRYRIDVDFVNYLRWREEKRNDINWTWDRVAAIVVEVPSMQDEALAISTLECIVGDCRNYGVKLIVDDVVTGFRYGPEGILGAYTLDTEESKADFICLGKALSTYGKVSAVIGPRSVMSSLEDEVFFSYTYNDSPLGLLDAYWTVQKYDRLGVWLYDHIDTIGRALTKGLNDVFASHSFRAELYGHPSRTAIACQESPEKLSEFLAKMIDEQNVLLHRPQFISMAHSLREVEITCEAAKRVLEMGR